MSADQGDIDSDYFERPRPSARYTSDSENDYRPHRPNHERLGNISGRSTPDLSSSAYGGHRKSVSFDLSGDERSKSDYERSRTPDGYSRYYDSEQECGSIRPRLPRKGILRSASPSSSNNSSLERCKRPEKLPPIVPTVARIKEIESPTLQYVRSSSPVTSREGSSSGYRSPPPQPEKVSVSTEIERENPFREAFLDKTKTDEYTELAKAMSKSPSALKSPRDHFFFGSKSTENLLASERSPSSGRSTPSTVVSIQSKSIENLASTGAKPKKIPPPILPKPKTKKAELVHNVALDAFQKADVGYGDFTVFEHDPTTNTIHEVRSPPTPPSVATPTVTVTQTTGSGAKLPVRVKGPRSPTRPRESPPPPPVNYATLPKLSSPSAKVNVKSSEESYYLEVLPSPPPPGDDIPPSQRRPTEFIHENSPDHILVTEEEHRTILLHENEIRNQLRSGVRRPQIPELGPPHDEAPPVPQYASIKHSVNPFIDSSDDNFESLPLPPPPEHLLSSAVLTPGCDSSSHCDSESSTINIISPISSITSNANMQPRLDLLPSTATIQTGIPSKNLLSPTQIFPTAQILPVQYTSLPHPQQPNTTNILTGTNNLSNSQQSQSFLTVGGLVLMPQVPFSSSASQASSSSSTSLVTTPIFLATSDGTAAATAGLYIKPQQQLQQRPPQLHLHQRTVLVSESTTPPTHVLIQPNVAPSSTNTGRTPLSISSESKATSPDTVTSKYSMKPSSTCTSTANTVSFATSSSSSAYSSHTNTAAYTIKTTSSTTAQPTSSTIGTPVANLASPTPSYTSMQFPTISEIVAQNSTVSISSSERPIHISTGDYQNTEHSLDLSTSTLASLESESTTSLQRTMNAASYYETAEEIYSTIEEEAIYSNTSFFDSRRSSDTSVNCRSSISPPPPPLPPKRPLKPTHLILRTAPPPPTTARPLKLRSQSQPQLVVASSPLSRPKFARVVNTPTLSSPPTGKETTV
ncbi:unnamed protein product [Ceratitis capitata]|uniref:(Mediterranean fruit fly) hypothetical protein n=1 Tax=Ceratitis capitata TaxID=7213 RepID=A0A811U7P9_CERCA|nr:unnamed protein product [Ceratitis capitata]